MTKKMKINVNGIKVKGATGFRTLSGDIDIEIDENGIPVDQFWRRRLKDAQIDGRIECLDPVKQCETVKPTKKRKGERR